LTLTSHLIKATPEPTTHPFMSMARIIFIRIFWAVLLCCNAAGAQTPPPAPVPASGGVCLTAEEKQKVVAAVQELKKIKDSPAVLKIQDPVEIISDWDGRVYLQQKIPAKLTIGDTIDRDLVITLDSKVAYRPKPPDPMFRLRIRAQAGVLIPQLFQTDSGWNKYDAQLALDFWHIGVVNVNVATGIRSAGGGVGIDLTKNFGPFLNYALVYDGFKSGILIGGYFSFN
jgi:hypothetical protein